MFLRYYSSVCVLVCEVCVCLFCVCVRFSFASLISNVKFAPPSALLSLNYCLPFLLFTLQYVYS